MELPGMCVVTLGLGLYIPVQQLIMSRADLRDRWILRPDELHISHAALRAIGSFIEGTEISNLWSIVYSDSTISHVITGKHFRRSLEAHIRMMVKLNDCYFALFFDKHGKVHSVL